MHAQRGHSVHGTSTTPAFQGKIRETEEICGFFCIHGRLPPQSGSELWATTSAPLPPATPSPHHPLSFLVIFCVHCIRVADADGRGKGGSCVGMCVPGLLGSPHYCL